MVANDRVDVDNNSHQEHDVADAWGRANQGGYDESEILYR